MTVIVTLAGSDKALPKAMSELRSKTVTAKKVRGLYRRGNTFWFAHQKGGRRRFVSLETNDYRLALARLKDLRAALEREDPLPTWRRMHLSKGAYWVQFHVCLNTGDAVAAAARADEIAATIQRINA